MEEQDSAKRIPRLARAASDPEDEDSLRGCSQGVRPDRGRQQSRRRHRYVQIMAGSGRKRA